VDERLLEHPVRIELNAVLAQQFQKLSLEIDAPMVLLLPLDIVLYIGHA